MDLPYRPARRRIFHASCPLLDAVLALAFDARELENLCTGAGVDLPHHPRLRTLRVAETIHLACHRDTPLARRIERILELRFAEDVAACERLGAREYGQMWFFDEPLAPLGRAGALWALATTGDPELRDSEARLARLVQLEAMAALRRDVEESPRATAPGTAATNRASRT